MSRHYKAITERVPVRYDADLDRIGVYFGWKRDDLRTLFQHWDLPPLAEDDCDALVDQLNRRVTGFALDCNALPLRTPRQLMATVKEIRANPDGFLRDPGKYDPEAAARVYGAFAGLSMDNRLLLARFEAGIGAAPAAGEIAAAAAKVLGDLQCAVGKKSRRGGQPLVLQQDLVRDLAKIFVNFGGRVTRITRFEPDARPQYIEVGPFHEFLDIVLPPARSFAKRAGFRMNSVRSLVSSVSKDGPAGS